ncbi:MAG TPA: hypothetical protein VMW25_02340 [Clostridia bacterium]|nr:hypothetical protein [Clostridia bacterium]
MTRKMILGYALAFVAALLTMAGVVFAQTPTPTPTPVPGAPVTGLGGGH